MDIESILRDEVVDLHEFFVRWYGGHADRSELDAVLARFHPDFLYVFPAGRRSSHADLARMLGASHGGNPAFRIEVTGFSFQALGGALWGVTYEEYQWGARNSASENGRISSAVFAVSGGQATWLRLHETWLPAAEVAAFHTQRRS